MEGKFLSKETVSKIVRDHAGLSNNEALLEVARLLVKISKLNFQYRGRKIREARAQRVKYLTSIYGQFFSFLRLLEQRNASLPPISVEGEDFAHEVVLRLAQRMQKEFADIHRKRELFTSGPGLNSPILNIKVTRSGRKRVRMKIVESNFKEFSIKQMEEALGCTYEVLAKNRVVKPFVSLSVLLEKIFRGRSAPFALGAKALETRIRAYRKFESLEAKQGLYSDPSHADQPYEAVLRSAGISTLR